MDSNSILFFSSKSQTSILQPSSPFLSSTNRPLISRQFLGFTHTRRPPGVGGASSLRKKHKQLAFIRLQSPRFVIRASANSNLVLVVIGVTALSALSLACYNKFFGRTEPSKKVSSSPRSALPQQPEGQDAVNVSQTAKSQNSDVGHLERQMIVAKEKDGLTEKVREAITASGSKEVAFQVDSMVNDDSQLAKATDLGSADCIAPNGNNFHISEESRTRTIELLELGAVQPLMFATEMSKLQLEGVEKANTFKAAESDSADCFASNGNDFHVAEHSGTTDIPLPHTELIESGAVQPLMFAAEMSELHLEEVKQANTFEATKSGNADCFASNGNDFHVFEQLGTTDLPLPHTELLGPGAVQPLMFPTEMSELRLEEVEQANSFEATESESADCFASNGNDFHFSEQSGTTDLPLPQTELLKPGAVRPITFATVKSELHLEEFEQVNKFEAGIPSIAVEPQSRASSVLVRDACAFVGDEVPRHHDIFRESAREELHTFYEADQLVASSTTLNGSTLNPLSSHLFSQNSNSVSPLKQNSEINAAKLSMKNSLQTSDMVDGKVTPAYPKRGISQKRKDFGRGGESPIDEGKSHLIHGKETKSSKFPFSNVKLANNKHHPEEHLSSYNRLLRHGRLSDCVDLLEDMEQRGLLDMNKVYHAKFFKICNKKKAVKEAFRFTKLIKNPTLSTFNMLMTVCASAKDSEGAFEVLRLVQEAGFKADCKLYTTLISTCAKSGKVDTMFEVFHDMVNSGVEPNVNTYGALIDGCARAGQVAKAFGAYGIMRSKNVKPDRVVFNALITACGQSGAVDRAFDVLAEMMSETQPIDPDHVTIGALIKACSNAGQVDRAREVYEMMHKFNIRGTPEVYTIAINACSQTGDWEFACNVYADMIRNGVAPDEVFISALIDVAGHAGKLDAAFEILEEAKNRGINSGIVSYSSLMGACSNARNWQKALELYENIKAAKLKLTVSTVNALITSLCEADKLPKAMEILSEMKELGLCPNTITYSILLVASEGKDDLEAGLMLLSQARKDEVAPNLVMCRCIIGMCLRRFEKACNVGEPLVSLNSGRPQIENKWTSVALSVYRETIVAGTVPTMELVSKVLGCLQLPRDYNLKSRLIENLEVSALSSRYSSLCSLIDGFGEYDPRAFSLLEEVASFGIVPCVSFKESPIVVDARELQINTAEVYLLTLLKGLKHRLAAGAQLPSISILLPLEKAQISTSEGEKSINLAGRIGQAIAALLRRIGLQYQGNESFGKIRINGLTLQRWFQPNLASPFTGKPGEWSVSHVRLGKGISHQQRNIRTGNLSFD